jgi:hypothetical protein
MWMLMLTIGAWKWKVEESQGSPPTVAAGSLASAAALLHTKMDGGSFRRDWIQPQLPLSQPSQEQGQSRSTFHPICVYTRLFAVIGEQVRR